MTPAEILKRPYHWVVIQDGDGTFYATIQEFPGCLADAETREDAITKLASVAESWLECTLELGQTVPEPDPPIWDRQRFHGEIKTGSHAVGNEFPNGE